MSGSPAHIRSFTPADGSAFERLNRAWIERYFSLEDKDRQQITDPDTYILGKGGRIIIAEDQENKRVVGCVALIPAGPQRVELAKMAVDESAQGQGIGGSILARAAREAKSMGANEIWLESNSRLEAALHLYRKYGFYELGDEEREDTPYERCNVQMIKRL